MKTNKEWAEHMIKRFGKKNAYRWAIVYKRFCPCIFLEKCCKSCKHSILMFEGTYHRCNEANEYFSKIFGNMKPMSEIKQIIIKKTKWWNRR